MDKTEALLGHFRNIAARLEVEARDHESGGARQIKGDGDSGADSAASQRQRAASILAVIDAYRRMKARKSGKPR